MSGENVIPLNAWKAQLQKGDNGQVKRNLTNLIFHLRNLPGLGKELRFNELSYQPEWRGRPIEDVDLVDIRLLLEREGFPPPDKDVGAAVNRVARENSYNPIGDYLDGLVWDGRPRIERWMIQLLGAPDTPFVRSVSPKVMISAVARALDPGCKVDTVLVIEGEQGIKKSSAIAALFGEEYTAESVSLFDQHNKMVMSMMGAWVVELAEFVAIARSHHASVKGLISMRKDKVVLPYAKMASTHPRRCVFFGTVNPEATGYLTDSTGNRRYWPVSVTTVDMEGIKRSRDQLWAEAVHRYRAGERWWLEPEEEDAARTAQTEREEEDAWAEPLRKKIQSEGANGRSLTEMTTDEALTLLGIPHERKDKRAQMRGAAALKAIGYERVEVRVGEKTRKVWRRI
jgi:predicted P-loop ATPase